MKPSNLLRTKFLVPRPGVDHLPRPHLIHWMESQSNRRLVLVSAPPGYGKTMMLASYLASSGRPAAWYQLDPSDSDPVIFLSCFIAALQKMENLPPHLNGQVGQPALALLESGGSGVDAQRVATVLVNELAEQMTGAWLVVLDDYHDITSPVVHQLVLFMLENAPPGLQFLISSRTDPPLALARLRARGQMAELRTADLRFREDEVQAWMELEVPGLSDKSLALLSEKTEGWAAALQIMRTSLTGHNPASAEDVITGLSGSQRFIFDYLAEEVFRSQEAGLQQFMLACAVLEPMEAPACQALSGRPDAQALLEQLEQGNLFTNSLDVPRRWFRFHNLFREFLLTRLQRQPARLQELHAAAAQYYETQGEWEAAFWHSLAVPDYAAAVQAVSKGAGFLVAHGHVEALHRYLSALPEDVLHQQPELLLQQGIAYLGLGLGGQAISAFEEARAGFAAVGDHAGVCRALTRLAELQRAQGSYRQAEKLASEAMEYAPAGDHLVRAGALMALAKSQGFLTDMNRGRALAEQAVQEARLAGERISPLHLASFLQSLGQICWWHGDPHAAVHYCQEALRLATEEPSRLAVEVNILLVTPYLYWRELEQAQRHAERGLEMAQTLQLKELLPAAYSALGNVLTRIGESARAENCLRQSLELAQQLGLASYEQIMSTGYLAYNLYLQGRVDEAWQLAEGALWSYSGSPDTYEAFVCRSVLADIELERNRYSRAEALYNELREVGERRQFRIPLALVYLGLAYIHLTSGRQESGLQHARRALELIEPTREFQLFIDQGERSRVVCQALLESGGASPFIERVLNHLPGRRGLPSLQGLDDSAVQVKCLGNLRVYAGGEEISAERWVSSKARDLLAYFITFRGERIPAERAYDAIWPHKTGRGLTAFHTALSRMRGALRTSQSSPRLVLVETGEYHLDAAHFNVDVDVFDTALKKARAAATEEAAAHWYEQAAGLYQGEYLQNLYYDWLLPERHRLTLDYLGALRQLATYHYTHQRYTQALELLQRALRVDNLIEDLHCQAMQVFAGLGDRAGLVRQYQELRDILSSELGILPLPSSERLFQRLLHGM